MSGPSPYDPHGDLPLDDRRRRLRFRAWHRGIKELDLIFGNFVDTHIGDFDDADCAWFETIFEEQDHEILAWITGEKDVPEAYRGTMMTRLQALDFMKLRAR